MQKETIWQKQKLLKVGNSKPKKQGLPNKISKVNPLAVTDQESAIIRGRTGPPRHENASSNPLYPENQSLSADEGTLGREQSNLRERKVSDQEIWDDKLIPEHFEKTFPHHQERQLNPLAWDQILPVLSSLSPTPAIVQSTVIG